jgi:hypothetical protein
MVSTARLLLAFLAIPTPRILPVACAVKSVPGRDARMMGSNSGGGSSGGGGVGGGGGGMGPGMGGPVAGGGDGRHDDEAALTEFLSSLMDYTPTVWRSIPLCLLT